MADVRLTAINPEDSQVYPVACNDKGELLLDSGGASGDLDVTGNLTVAGTAEFASYATAQGSIRAGGGGDLGNTTGVFLGDYGDVHISSANSTQSALRVFDRSSGSGNSTIDFKIDGSASFSGNTQVGNSSNGVLLANNGAVVATTSDTSSNKKFILSSGGAETFSVSADGSAQFNGTVSCVSDLGTDGVFNGRYNDSVTSSILSNGAASFATGKCGFSSIGEFFAAGGVNTGSASNDGFFVSTTGTIRAQKVDNSNSNVFQAYQGTANTVQINSNGSATFNGNVTAPNINFKLAPADVAAMPAPLIDEGFAANNTVDLLGVIMEMKLQIRDLNAFMQRSTQDDPET